MPEEAKFTVSAETRSTWDHVLNSLSYFSDMKATQMRREQQEQPQR
jgi:hypothetical protein